jgi:ribosomal protein L20A (L18A)
VPEVVPPPQGDKSPTTSARATLNGDGQSTSKERQDDSRVLLIVYRLVTASLWLRTVILITFSVILIVGAFHWNVITRPNIWSYLAAQLGTGLLVVAVGAALVQGFIMSAPETWRKLVNQLRSESRETSQEHVNEKLDTINKVTTEGIRVLETQMSQLVADMERHNLRTLAPDDKAIHEAGVVGVYTAGNDATNDMMACLKDPRTMSIRLLGLSLADWFGARRKPYDTGLPVHLLDSLLRGEPSATSRGRPLTVRVLLLDPRCAAARLFVQGGGEPDADDRLSRLHDDAERTARYLMRLRDEVAGLKNVNSVEVRFYRAVPSLFALSTDMGSFVRPYFAGLDTRESLAATWRYSDDSVIHKATCGHFDAVWRHASVSAEAILKEKSDGTDRGISEAGICNIYTDIKDAQERIAWLISSAKERVWLQGVSLVHHVGTPLIDTLSDLVRKETVDTRFLILDPDCEEAYRKSYRDYLLDTEQQGATPSFDDYHANKNLHEGSAVYKNIRYATQILAGIIGTKPPETVSLRHYTCAPTSYILIADNRALVEQFHYGKSPSVTGSARTRLNLAREMPLVELERPLLNLYEVRRDFDPLAVITDHFSSVFDVFSHPPDLSVPR